MYYRYIPKKKETFRSNLNYRSQFPGEQRITTDTTLALVSKLKPEHVYEIRVRIVLPRYGIESRWSDVLYATPPFDINDEFNDDEITSFFFTSTPAFGIQRRVEFCDFELVSICDFINDAEATLNWRRQVVESENFLGKIFYYNFYLI